ncbi:MAG: glycoside hydrolase family 31 protein [Dysgonomonas sp.]|nr:glycoside hydrolase family 31 protein [Dysgonomonas sp.]
MILKKSYLFLLFLSISLSVFSQNVNKSTIDFLQDEYWWGAYVSMGSQMPFIKSVREADLEKDNKANQSAAFFLSNKGRYIWSSQPFSFEIKERAIVIKSGYEDVKVIEAGKTLKEAYLTACKSHFPPTGTLPDPLFFSKPQYNTWIELMYNQNEDDIVKYAQSIVDNGFPTGVLMIDDNWQRYYGNFDFRAEKFRDPKGMIGKLHAMGFKVMLWISPFVSPDSAEYRELSKKGYLIKAKGSKSPAIIDWWNGKSACYDLTNPEAFDYFVAILKNMQKEYGVDGFKLDAGDVSFYNTDTQDFYNNKATGADQSRAWAKVGVEFSFNEYRACWQMQGQPLVQRLSDKNYSWGSLRLLIPDMIAAGLLGWAYTCPDMIGGGEFSSFLNKKSDEFDQALIVRSAQVHTLMPMMQFSVAPWRILDANNLEIVRQMAHLHEKMGSYILDLAKESSIMGEPIIRHMEYEFPNEGFAECKDQFMLGNKYLVAPILSKDNKRTVKLPKGKWVDDKGKNYKGGKGYDLDIAIDRLLYFEKR